ncbi:MAG: YczE/YyaS/YitT family protein [Bilifractor sp.]|jgi:uncharacterized membrane protein YczE
MRHLPLVKRYLYFILGLFINSLGVAFITNARLGTSPISSIPYVLSLKYPLTLGGFTILFSLLLVALQILLLRKNYQPIQLLQIPVSILFGYFIDFSMKYLIFWLNPQQYLMKIISLLIGCLILAFGVSMEFTANVIMLPGEGLATALHKITGKEAGSIKIIVDVSMMASAVILSLLLFHGINGVREGTVISAVIVGYIARHFCRLLNPVMERWFEASSYSLNTEQ